MRFQLIWHNKPSISLWCITALLPLAAANVHVQAADELPNQTCAVTSTGNATASGRNWANAKTLQAALADASCHSIWLKEGVYKPIAPVTPSSPSAEEINTSFLLHRPVKVYGGFKGTETTFEARPKPVSPLVTVLSGDIGNDDCQKNQPGNCQPLLGDFGVERLDNVTIVAFGDRPGFDRAACATRTIMGECELADAFGFEYGDQKGLNSRHVVRIQGNANYTPTPENTVIDGLTITAGNADGAAGGGLLCDAGTHSEQCSPTLSHLMMLGNHASYGGSAMHFEALGKTLSPRIDSVFFYGNLGSDKYEASLVLDVQGILHAGNNVPNGRIQAHILNTTFMHNAGAMSGGIQMFADQSQHAQTRIDHSAFLYNHGSFDATINGSGSNLTVIVRNSLSWGGVRYSYNNPLLPSYSFMSPDQTGYREAPGQALFDVASSILTSCWQKPTHGHNCVPIAVAPGEPPLTRYWGWPFDGGQSHVNPSFDPRLPNRFTVRAGALTAPPLPNSPALNASACLPDAAVPTDALDTRRPQGERCDLGPVERPLHTLTLLVQGEGSVAAHPLADSGPSACSSDTTCRLGYWFSDSATTVHLTPTPGPSAALLANTCAEQPLVMNRDRSCTISFYNSLQVPRLPDAHATVGVPFHSASPSPVHPSVGGALNWTAQGLPASLSMDPNSGMISGTPDTAGVYTIVVTATDRNGISGSTSHVLTVDKIPPQLTLPEQTITSRAFSTNLRFAIAPQASSTSIDSPAGAITYQSLTPATCTTSDAQVLVHAVGVCRLQAVQAESANHWSAMSNPVDIEITPGQQNLVFPEQLQREHAFVQHSSFALNPLASSNTDTTQRPIVYSSQSPEVCSVQGEHVTMRMPGVCTVAANQGGDHNHTAAAPQVQTITLHPQQQFTGTTVPQTPALAGQASATFTGGGETCTFAAADTRFEAAPRPAKPGHAMPQGVFRFKLTHCEPGSTVRMRVTWPHEVLGYQKFGMANAADTQPSYFDLAGVQINGNTVQFSITDGQQGDDDWQANGTMTDPAGPWQTVDTKPVPTLNGWMVLALASLVGGASLCHRQRLRRQQAPSASTPV